MAYRQFQVGDKVRINTAAWENIVAKNGLPPNCKIRLRVDSYNDRDAKDGEILEIVIANHGHDRSTLKVRASDNAVVYICTTLVTPLSNIELLSMAY